MNHRPKKQDYVSLLYKFTDRVWKVVYLSIPDIEVIQSKFAINLLHFF